MTYFDNTTGWEYISAIFSYFRDIAFLKERTSHIAPKYIYRGITRRYFTESECIRNILKEYKEKKCVTFNNVDITNELREDCIATLSKFKENAKHKPYNDFLKPNNGLTLEERKERDESEILYYKLYKKLKDKIEKEIEDVDKANCCSKNIESYIKVLETINQWTENKLTQPEQIRSGASVRLRDVDKKYLTVSDYLSYINNLIFNFRKANTNFREYSELEILAEIQHRGGASCLVDFSKNFLISLWFATNNDPNEPGYLFCYNVNADALSEDNITILNKDRWEYPIENLLRFTRKTAQYAGGDKFRFWLWKPANINGRIARQDSMFVFGLEKFYTNTHNVDIITIPSQWKSAIVETLKTYFGITSETVFPDVDGYAGSHSKTSKIDSISHYLNLNCLNNSWKSQTHREILQRGMSCLLNGQYKLALDYFLRIYPCIKFDKKNSTKEQISDFNINLIRLEVIYSIGLCYKKLREYNSAEYFLNKAFSSSHELKTGNKLNSKCEPLPKKNPYLKNIPKDKQSALFSKFMKITDDYLDVLCKLQRYAIAKQAIFLLMSDQSMTINQHLLECFLQRLSILDGIKNAHISTCLHIEPFDLEIKDCPDIFVGLNRYHNLVRSVLCNPDHVITQGKLKAKSETMVAYNLFEEYVKHALSESYDNESPNNIVWEFDEIPLSVNEYFQDAKYTYLKEFIEDVTSQIKSIFDIITSHNRTL